MSGLGEGHGEKLGNLNTGGERGSGAAGGTGAAEAPLPAASARLSRDGRDLAEPGGGNNAGQVPAELRERPGPVSLSALSQVQKSNLLVTPLAPLGNF